MNQNRPKGKNSKAKKVPSKGKGGKKATPEEHPTPKNPMKRPSAAMKNQEDEDDLKKKFLKVPSARPWKWQGSCLLMI